MDLDVALDLLADDPTAPLDVAELGLSLARDEYPDLDVTCYIAKLDQLADAVRPCLRGSLRERVAALGASLFEEHGFRGNATDYYDPRNSYLNEVLDRRTGIPITLSVVTMSVGQRAGLEVVGVGLPGHFIVKAVGAGGNEVLFDPFHFGRLLTARDCERLVREVTGLSIDLTPEHLEGTPTGRIVLRMLSNLKAIYCRAGDFPRAARVIERLCRLDPGDLCQRRDLGVCLARAGRAGAAIDHLEAYLCAAEGAADAATVRRFLTEARAQVARWN
jgi:regulator of sirC expression with transglutaminase-like and TPR domain